MVSDKAISLLLGYMSMACWLGAQLPQILVNWRRKSVDGLALPFLASWFLGDTTNLVGCLLTNQLPFQTYLAAYFVSVDICLLAQYLHYDAARHAKALSTLPSPSARTSPLLPRSIAYSPQAYTLPRSSLPRSRSRSYSLDQHTPATVADVMVTSGLDLRLPDPHGMEADVSQRRWRSRESRRTNSLEDLPESVVADPPGRQWGGRLLEHEPGDEAVDAESESSPSIMVDSFSSEAGARPRMRGKHVSWSSESPAPDRSARRLSQDPLPRDSRPDNAEPPVAGPSTVRGRQLTRLVINDSAAAADAPPDTLPRSRRASTASTLSAAASRRGAGIVFLGIFALFGLSSQAEHHMRRAVQGEVLSAPPRPDTFPPSALAAPSIAFAPSALAAPSVTLAFASRRAEDLRVAIPEGNTRRLIGRVSAWTCTTLYITSRLPQIWKNFARKSVEGLSMYLFGFAFLGNLFYVLSILTSPKIRLPGHTYLRDSVPYLIGSGGTLLFDVTIVLQGFVYAAVRRPRTGDAEEQALLADDGVR